MLYWIILEVLGTGSNTVELGMVLLGSIGKY